jgi:enhancing lycopene biosynthesis protein 2
MSAAIKAVVGVILIVVGTFTSFYGGSFLIKVGAILLLNAAADALAPSPGKPPVQPVDVAYSGTLEPRRILYGQMKISGMHTLPPLTSGSNNDFVHIVLSMCGHKITAIDDVYFDTTRIASGDIANVAHTLNDGLVSGNVTNNGYQGKAWIRRYDGTQTLTDTILKNNFTAWDANHIGHGIPYLAVQLQFDPKIFTAGVPQITAVCRGKKLYDPRKDSTNGGSGPHRNLDESTWEYSTNPALTTRDYLVGPLGLGEAQSRIDDVLVAAAANKCDEALTVPIPVLVGITNWTTGSKVVNGQGTVFKSALQNGWYVMDPTGVMVQVATVDSDTQFTLAANYSHASQAAQITQFNSTSAMTQVQARYTCSTLLDCTARPEDNIATLAGAMMGRCFYSSGKWRMLAGAWYNADFALTEDDLVGGISVQCSTPRKDLYNAVRGNYINPQKNYTPDEFPAVLNSAFETEDRERIYTETNFSCCTDRYEVQRNAMVLSRQSRNRHTITAQFGMSAFKIRPMMTGIVTIAEIGWFEQTVRCDSWRMYPNGTIEIQLTEAYSADWIDPLLTDYSITGINTAPPPGQYLPYPPTGLTFISVASGIQFVITLPAQVIAGTLVQIFEGLTSGAYAGGTATLIAEMASTTIVIPKRDTVARFYWVRTKGPNGQFSPVFPTGNGIQMSADRIQTAEIADQAVTNSKIADGSLTPSKFVSGLQFIQIVSTLPALPNAAYPPGNSFVYLSTDNQLYTNNANVWQSISDNPAGSITTTQIADGAITTPKIAANAVVANSILAGSITAAKCVSNMIIAGSALIADGAITNAKIGDLEVNNAKIQNLTIGTAKISDGAVTGIGIGTAATGTYGAGQTPISFNYTTSGGALLIQLDIGGDNNSGGVQSTASFRINNAQFSQIVVSPNTNAFGNLDVPFRWNGMTALLNQAPGTYTFAVTIDSGSLRFLNQGTVAIFEFKK